MSGLAAGRLRHRVTLQQPVETQDSVTGAVIINWQDVADLWAAIEPLSAKEFIAAQAVANQVTSKIIIRYRSDINARMRFFHDATGLYYNIEGILTDKESGRDYITVPVSEGLKFQDQAGQS
jgi:SPP1 family predicted phage head-tail adaptor